jgi:outer membrane protein OmpA-like peptidoglycan-associated protein
VREIQLRKAPPPASAPAPAPAPAPAVAPGPEPPARDYLIYFDFDKSTIRGDSARVLEEVIEAMGRLKATGMSLIGHADRAGSNAYNQRLSERRAGSVKDYLVGHGVAAGEVATQGKGESDPRVRTPDGIREELNRRVEIRIE